VRHDFEKQDHHQAWLLLCELEHPKTHFSDHSLMHRRKHQTPTNIEPKTTIYTSFSP